MKRLLRIFFGIVAMLTASLALATTYHLRGAGTSSCGKWTADRQGSELAFTFDEEWVFGFLSGVGYEGFHDPLKGVDTDAVIGWINNYCEAHPLNGIAVAAAAFTEVHPR